MHFRKMAHAWQPTVALNQMIILSLPCGFSIIVHRRFQHGCSVEHGYCFTYNCREFILIRRECLPNEIIYHGVRECTGIHFVLKQNSLKMLHIFSEFCFVSISNPSVFPTPNHLLNCRLCQGSNGLFPVPLA